MSESPTKSDLAATSDDGFTLVTSKSKKTSSKPSKDFANASMSNSSREPSSQDVFELSHKVQVLKSKLKNSTSNSTGPN